MGGRRQRLGGRCGGKLNDPPTSLGRAGYGGLHLGRRPPWALHAWSMSVDDFGTLALGRRFISAQGRRRGARHGHCGGCACDDEQALRCGRGRGRGRSCGCPLRSALSGQCRRRRRRRWPAHPGQPRVSKGAKPPNHFMQAAELGSL